MEEGKPRSNEVPKIEALTEEEILHLLDVATDYKIRRGEEAEGNEASVPDTVKILADLLTIQEHFGYLREIAFCCLGGASGALSETWQTVCEKMGMEWLAQDQMPELSADGAHDDATAVAMETDADEQQLFLYRLPASHLTTEAVMYAITHASSDEESTDET